MLEKQSITQHFKEHLGFLLGYLEQVQKAPSSAEVYLLKKSVWQLHDKVQNALEDVQNEEA